MEIALTRSERLRRHCDESGLKKQFIAERELGIAPRELSVILRLDLDAVITAIDNLPETIPSANPHSGAHPEI